MLSRSEDIFVAERSADWTALEALLIQVGSERKTTGGQLSETARLYRALCHDLMRARAKGMSVDLLVHLDALAARAHNRLYGARPVQLGFLRTLVTRDFPRTLRKNARYLWLSVFLFMAPWLVGLLGALESSEMAAAILGRDQLDMLVESWSSWDPGRSTGKDTQMAGFYIRNNIGIAFRCFATGIFFGLGSVFFLVYNGLSIGVVTGFVMSAGYGENIHTFMCGHAPFEITAIFISVAAGLKLGHAITETGGLTRFGSVRAQGRELFTLIIGAALMMAVAAFIEGYWSLSAVPKEVKWAVAPLLWLLVIGYLARTGREEGVT